METTQFGQYKKQKNYLKLHRNLILFLVFRVQVEMSIKKLNKNGRTNRLVLICIRKILVRLIVILFGTLLLFSSKTLLSAQAQRERTVDGW